MGNHGVAAPTFRHEALFYRDDEEFLAGTVPFVREALSEEAAVLVALPAPGARRLRGALGEDSERVRFADMEQLGRNPGRIIGAWRDFVRDHAGDVRAPRGIGEPIWPGRSADELVECERHETLLNLAFGPTPAWWLLCPYDAGRLAPEVLDGARRNHPHLVERGAGRLSDAYARSVPGDDPLAPPAAEPAELPFTGSDLGTVRDFVVDRARHAGLSRERLADLVLAIDELATNSLRYAGGHGTLRTWREDGALLCEVADGGHIADPLAGRDLPRANELSGRGLWLVNQLCDLVQVRSSPGASVVRVQMRVEHG